MIIRFWGRDFFIPVWVKFVVIGLVGVALILSGFLIVKSRSTGVVTELKPTISVSSPEPTAEPSASTIPKTTSTISTTIFVYIVGEIKNPDVYEIEDTSILRDLVSIAGGFTENADLEAINLASKLSSGMMIKIPAKDSEDKSWIIDNGASDSDSSNKTGKVNINTASVSELTTLPGIGESTALKIINYRTENGPFSMISDITNISGIKTSRFNEIKDYITVD